MTNDAANLLADVRREGEGVSQQFLTNDAANLLADVRRAVEAELVGDPVLRFIGAVMQCPGGGQSSGLGGASVRVRKKALNGSPSSYQTEALDMLKRKYLASANAANPSSSSTAGSESTSGPSQLNFAVCGNFSIAMIPWSETKGELYGVDFMIFMDVENQKGCIISFADEPGKTKFSVDDFIAGLQGAAGR